jgi:hypothetical protein
MVVGAFYWLLLVLHVAPVYPAPAAPASSRLRMTLCEQLHKPQCEPDHCGAPVHLAPVLHKTSCAHLMSNLHLSHPCLTHPVAQHPLDLFCSTAPNSA